MWSFQVKRHRRNHKRYPLPTVLILDCNIMINESNLLGLPIRNNMKAYENLKQIATNRGVDYANGFGDFILNISKIIISLF